MVMLPSRDEGYGLKDFHIDAMIKQDVKLLVTVDCGIRSIEEIRKAKNNGIKVIVLDHHIPGTEIPNADAIIDLHWQQGNYPTKSLTGAGLAFKVAQHLAGSLTLEDADLAAVGTIGDVEDIGRGENRTIVKKALKSAFRNIGLKSLYDCGPGVVPNPSAEDIAFGIAPKINAAGRLEHNGAIKPFELLVSNEPEKIRDISAELTEKNNGRKKIQADCFNEIKSEIESQVANNKKVLMAICSSAPVGIVGLLAGKIKEKYNRPVIIFSKKNENEIAGSARSIKGYDIFKNLDKQNNLLVTFGGHELAAGLTLNKDNFTKLFDALNAEADKQLTDDMIEPQITYCFDIDGEQINDSIFKELDRCEPFGAGNPKPVFKVNITTKPISNACYQTFGVNGEHLRLKIANDLEAVGFDMTEKYVKANCPYKFTAYGTLKKSYYMGKERRTLQMIDFEAVEAAPQTDLMADISALLNFA